MASIKTKFSVGLFLLIGSAVLVVGVIWLGMSNYLEKGRFFVAYFDESVQGLDKDSPVKYRGVSIGRVQRIGVAPDEKLIEVVMKVESEIEPEKLREEAVAQLKSVGITGLMFVELERKTPGEPSLSPAIDFTPPYTVIATRPSDISKIFKGIEDVFNLFRAIDTEAISRQLTEALAKINKSIDDAQVAELIADVRTAVQGMQNLLDQNEVQDLLRSANQAADNMNRLTVNADEGITEMRQTVAGLDRIILKSGDDVAAVTADLRASSLEVKRAMETAAIMLESTDRQLNLLQRQVLITVNRIDQAGRSLNRILEQVANQPSQVIFGGAVPDKPSAP